MEDLKAYIESGVLELYVLDDLPPGERLEVDRMLEKYPELKTELAQIEKALQNYSEVYAVEPPEHLRSSVLQSLDNRDTETAQIIPVQNRKSGTFFKYAFAASVALLLLSIVAIFNLYSQLRDYRNQIAALKESNQKFSRHASFIEEQLSQANQSLAVFHNPDVYKLVSLKGTPNAPSASLVVAFSPEKQEVMIDLGSVKMPANDAEHQYQLWALVDGKPVDLGVFDSRDDSTGMVKMKSLKNAQAFAVTLEPKGGSVNPTMEQMMAMGTI